MKVQEFFDRRPVFTRQEFDASQDIHEPRGGRRGESLLAYYSRTGRILRVRRGLYVLVPLGVDPDASPVDPYLLAAKMTKDAVLAYHTALEFHGKAYSILDRFLYLTGRTPRPVKFRSYDFRGVLFPKPLRENRKENFGVHVTERTGVEVRVTDFERTLVDLLDRPNLGGSWEEIWRSLELVEFFDLDQVVEYALLLENSTTVAKVGFFLDQHRETLMVDEAHLKPLRKLRPKKPHYMVRSHRSHGRLVKDWNLVVPPEVLERNWAEVT